MTAETKYKLNTIAENLFLAVMGAYLFYLGILTTTFNFTFPEFTESVLLKSLAAVSLLRLGTLFILEPSRRKNLLIVTLCAVLMAFDWMMVYRNDGYNFLRFLAVLTVGCAGIDFRKVLKTYVIVIGTTFLAAVFCALGDTITNFIYSGQYRIRSSWGICYPTDFASYMIFLLAAAWISWNDLPDWFFLIPGTGALFIAYFIADSNTSSYCCLLFLLLVMLRIPAERGLFGKFGKIAEYVSCLAFPVFGMITLGLTWLYHHGNRIGILANAWMHNRLKYCLDAYDRYGFKLFGSPLSQVGSGFSIVSRTDYNFVDITYLLIMLRYGMAAFVLVSFLWSLMSFKAARTGNRRLLYSLFLIAFHSISEHHFTEINYNILLILPFAVLYPALNSFSYAGAAERTQGKQKSRHLRAALLAVIGSLLLAAAFSPQMLSVFRTVCTIFNLKFTNDHKQRLLFAGVAAGFVFLFLLGYLLYRVLMNITYRERPKNIHLAGLALCFLMAAAGLYGVNRIFRRSLPDWQSTIAEDKKAIDIVQSTNTPLYITDVPEIYRLENDEIGYAFYGIEDSARLHNVTLITDSDWDSSVLVGRGFLYAVISDRHAMYTNAEPVIKAMTDEGFHLSGYYSREKSVKLSEFRAINELRGWDDGGEFISWNKPLKYGPYLTLFNSTYKVSFDLSHLTEEIPDAWDSMSPDAPVCTLRVSRNYGQNIIEEMTLTRGQFTGDELMTAEIVTNIPNAEGVEFLVFPAEGDFSLIVHAICYQKTPAYDTHAVYDSDWHRIHEAYFDAEGNPFTVSSGYHAVDFGYDRENNRNYYRYYNADGAPVRTRGGYAELHREFGISHRIISESYFDENRSPVVLSEGFSHVEYEYDNKGNREWIYYFDADHNPVMINSGTYSIRHRIFDAKARIIREEFFDIDRQPAVTTGGYFAVEYSRDDAGNILEYRYYGRDNELTVLPSGYSIRRMAYDDKNQVIWEGYFDPEGDPVSIPGK